MIALSCGDLGRESGKEIAAANACTGSTSLSCQRTGLGLFVRAGPIDGDTRRIGQSTAGIAR